MPFKKGQVSNPKGRTPGVPNKLTKSAREAYQLAFEGLGGLDALIKWGKENQSAFYQIHARLIPVEHVGEGGEGPIQTIVKHIYSDDKQGKP